MASCVVLPLRLGQTAAEPASDDLLNMYRLVASWFDQNAVQLAPTIVTTIPVPLESESRMTSSEVKRRLELAAFPIVIVDLANSSRPILPSYSVISATLEACNGRAREIATPSHTIVLLNAKLWEADPAAEPIRQLVETGAGSVLLDDGSILTTRDLPKQYSREAYVTALRAARMSPLESLKQKITRQHGHFKRNKNGIHDHCVWYFFDAHHCINELTSIIVHDFTKIESGADHTQLFVYAPESPWLIKSADAAAVRLGLPLDRIELDAEPQTSSYEISDRPYILVSVCDTGQTCHSIIQRFRKMNPECSPTVFAILSTEGLDEQQGRRVLEFDGQSLSIRYLLRVDQPHHLPGACRQCRVGLPETILDHRTVNTPEISTFAMWSMLLESGLKVEDDVPKGRPSLGLVPNFPEVIDRNGPYLAGKLNAELYGRPGKLPRHPIVVCPNEVGAHTLASALTSVFKYTVIRIPRDALRKAASKSFSEDDKTNAWWVQLASLQARNEHIEVIALDEFNASASTRLSLKAIAESFGLKVRCYVSLFDFNPKLRPKMDAKVYSLYSINWLDGYTHTSLGNGGH